MRFRTGWGRRAALLLLLGLAACTHLEEVSCGPGAGKSHLLAELLFGHNIGDRVGVSEAAFRRYVDEELTQRFPDGLTVLEARGQWKDTEAGHIVREPAKVVMIAVTDSPEARAKLTAAAEAYKKRFNQQSVGLILRKACVSF